MDKPRLSRIERLKNKRKIVVVKPKDGEQGDRGLTGDRGLMGEQGDRGPIGKTGAIGPRGPLGYRGLRGEKGQPGQDGIDGKGITWTGQWESYRKYTVNDAVINFGTAYICIADHKSGPTNQPGVGSLRDKFWSVLAERGEAGPAGGPGANGVAGAPGAGLAAGGTTGQIIAKNSNADYDTIWEDAPSGLPSQTGNNGKYLTTNGSAASWATVPAGGQTVATKIVAASGGDYTTLGAAIAAASAGWVILVQPGTYSESSLTNSTADLTVIGLSRNECIIQLGGNWSQQGARLNIAGITIDCQSNNLTLGNDNQNIQNCLIKGSGSTGVLTVNSGNFQKYANNILLSTSIGSSGVCFDFNCARSIISDNVIIANSGRVTTFRTQSVGNVISGNMFNLVSNSNTAKTTIIISGNNSAFTGNVLNLIQTNQTGISITGNNNNVSANQIINAVSAINNAGQFNTISANQINGGAQGTPVGITSSQDNNMITGNAITSGFVSPATGTGITVGANYNVVTGNMCDQCATGINVTSGTKNILVGNNTTSCTTGITDSGTTTTNTGNA